MFFVTGEGSGRASGSLNARLDPGVNQRLGLLCRRIGQWLKTSIFGKCWRQADPPPPPWDLAKNGRYGWIRLEKLCKMARSKKYLDERRLFW